MTNCYILQTQPNYNFNAALEHADHLTYVFTSHGDVGSLSEERIKQELTENLKKFGKEDFLLLTGDPELIAMAAHIILQKQKEVKLLKYNKYVKRYTIRRYVK